MRRGGWGSAYISESEGELGPTGCRGCGRENGGGGGGGGGGSGNRLETSGRVGPGRAGSGRVGPGYWTKMMDSDCRGGDVGKSRACRACRGGGGGWAERPEGGLNGGGGWEMGMWVEGNSQTGGGG